MSEDDPLDPYRPPQTEPASPPKKWAPQVFGWTLTVVGVFMLAGVAPYIIVDGIDGESIVGILMGGGAIAYDVARRRKGRKVRLRGDDQVVIRDPGEKSRRVPRADVKVEEPATILTVGLVFLAGALGRASSTPSPGRAPERILQGLLGLTFLGIIGLTIYYRTKWRRLRFEGEKLGRWYRRDDLESVGLWSGKSSDLERSP
jgi:hypothetical protein